MIQLIPIDNQQLAFRQQLELSGRLYTFRFYYNSRFERWHMDVLDRNDSPIIVGQVVNLGADLFRRFALPTLPGGLLSTVDFSGREAEPSIDNFGQDVQLVYDEAN